MHSRFSTNTFPSWPLAHPFRFVAHNGEINTIRGNRNRMRAREALLAADAHPRRPVPAVPDLLAGRARTPPPSTRCWSCCTSGGRSLPHAVLMMIPEAWENHATMEPERRAFYQFHASLMEPWDGPACVTFTDGSAGRRGAGPQRPAPGPLVAHRRRPRGAGQRGRRAGRRRRKDVVAKGRLKPGRMFLVDTEAGRIVDDEEVKSALAGELPYDEWLHAGLLKLAELPDRDHVVQSHDSVLRRQLSFGYTEEELQDPARADGRERRRADRLDGHRHPARRAVASDPGCSTTTSSRTSRR